MRVADLRPPVAPHLAGGLLGALDQPGIRGQLLRPGEAGDVVDLVEDHQREDLADPRHGAHPVERVGVATGGGAQNEVLQLTEQRVVLRDQREVAMLRCTLASANRSTTAVRLPR